MSKGLVNKVKGLEDEGKITRNQLKGILLEIATYIALEQLGIKPIPLHNPFDENYSKDYHLYIDLLFFHNGLLYGVECKNLSILSDWWKNKEWVEDEIVQRFNNLKEKSIDIDVKVLIVSYYRESMEDLTKEYKILEIGDEVNISNIHEIIFRLSKLILSLVKENKLSNSPISTHGYKQCYKKLKYIEKVLKEGYK